MRTAIRAPATATTTIATRVRDRAARSPSRVAMREKDLGIWQEVTWADYWEQVQTVAHALLALGVEPGDRAAVHCENRREWLYADLATVAVRGTTMGLYPTNPPAEVSYLLAHSGSKVLIAEDQEQVDKVLAVLDEVPELEYVVYIEPRGIRDRYDAEPATAGRTKLLFWDDFRALGERHREEHPDAVERRMAEAGPDDIMALIYTSGTTGPPKGAMLSVENVEYAIKVLVDGGGFTSPPPGENDLILSYLPLCHVAERIFTTWFNAATGVQVNFAESIETVPENLREVQPTILFGVPRIWEKILASVEIRLNSATPLKRLTARWWLRVADRIGDVLVKTGGRHTPATRIAYALGWPFCFRALGERIGMRRVRYAASGAAPIAPDVLKFFMGIGVAMHEVYGMTENSAVATANRPHRIKLGTVGEPHPGVELRIDRVDDTDGGEDTAGGPEGQGGGEDTAGGPEGQGGGKDTAGGPGEILTRHPGVFVGYWRDEAATRAVKEPDGWLHTGDLGEWVDGTHVRIVGRTKEIIITSGGKNVAPAEIENALKASPYIKEAVVLGDRRAYLTALIGIELDTVGEWARLRGIPYTTYRDLSERPEVRGLVREVIDEVNGRFARAEQIKDVRLLSKELDHEDGELTATQKVKRGAIERLFGDLVDSLYGGAR